MSVKYISIVDGEQNILSGVPDTCDRIETLDNYATEVTHELRKTFPGVVVAYRFERSDRGVDVQVVDGDYNPDDWDGIVTLVQVIAERVYERGTFWEVMK